VVAAGLYVLYFRRTPLPPTAPHARAVPVISTIPGISACWVETAKTFSSFSFGMTAGSVLVKHPAGDLLIDTGSSTHYDRVISAYTQKFPPVAAPTLRFEPTPYETFDESADLYGDGSVVVVPLRGHTPGSVGVFVNLSPTRRLFYLGDAVDDESGFEERAGKSLILRDSDNDMPLANQIVGRLSELHERVPGLAMI